MRHLAIVLGVLAAACSQAGPQQSTAVSSSDAGAAAPPTAAPANIALEPAKGAVLPAEKAEMLARQCSRIAPGPVVGTWLPAQAEIAELEAGLGAELAAQLKPGDDAKPEDYYRQYAGLVVGAERRIIYVNGIHRSAVERAPEDQRESWKTEPVLICDGGAITFGVEYDPATKMFEKFAFNGRI